MCDVAWYNEFLGLNPLERKRRDLVVAYAEKQGGVVQEYVKALFPRYWQKVGSSAPGAEGDALSLSVDQQVRILVDMSASVLPGLRSVAGFDQPDRGGSLRYPKSVPHL